MDGSLGMTEAALDLGAPSGPLYPVLVKPARSWALLTDARGLTLTVHEDLETVVLTKSVAGFDDAAVEAWRMFIRAAAAGQLGRLKFLVFDFAHSGVCDGVGADNFLSLTAELSNLILSAPVISVACARAGMAGADLEFALGCSMLIGEEGARFSFDLNPVEAVDVYGLLSRKLGFVRAERLMESGEVLDCAGMNALLLLKDIAPAGAGQAGIEQFLRRMSRKHNSHYGIYRAQRINSRTTEPQSARAGGYS
jgi:enoyl-CoA hydratase/carnithine racemase